MGLFQFSVVAKAVSTKTEKKILLHKCEVGQPFERRSFWAEQHEYSNIVEMCNTVTVSMDQPMFVAFVRLWVGGKFAHEFFIYFFLTSSLSGHGEATQSNWMCSMYVAFCFALLLAARVRNFYSVGRL